MSRKGTYQHRATLKSYAFGVAQDLSGSIADFIAPRVSVGIASGFYKKFGDKNAFQVYQTARALGGPATRMQFEADDAQFNCRPNALEAPIDDHDREQAGDSASAMEEALTRDLVTNATIAREAKVVGLVKSAVTAEAGKGVWSSSSADPIAEIDEAIHDIAVATGMMPNRMVLGLGAWKVLKNHAAVLARRPGAEKATIDLGFFSSQLLNPQMEIKVGLLSMDQAKLGKAKSAVNVVGAEVFVFVGSANPTRYDPSFAKTFSIGGNSVEDVYTYRDDKCRSDILAVDWSEDVQVVSNLCAKRITLS